MVNVSLFYRYEEVHQTSPQKIVARTSCYNLHDNFLPESKKIRRYQTMLLVKQVWAQSQPEEASCLSAVEKAIVRLL